MNKHISALIFSLVGLLALFVYGCCSSSKDGFFVSPQNDTIVLSREVIIDELGRLPTVTFPSGAKIEGLEENTLTPGIVVTIVEQKTTSQNIAYFSNNSYDGIYLYKITAYQRSSNISGGKTSVTTTEKPLKVTLPKTLNFQGITLAGIKESDTDPWRLFTFSDSNKVLPNDAGLTDAGTNTAENTFNLFSLGTQFALVPYGGNADNNLPETYVTSLVASSTPSILVKDGKYSEDLTIKGIMKGVNLDSIKPTDLMTRITYRNNKAEETRIKVNGVNVSQANKEDKSVPGYSYCHSFVVDSVNDYSLMGNEGEYSFTINLDGIETESFPSSFLIEFYNKVDSEKILPYNYTEFYTLNKVEDASLVISAVDGSIADEAGNFFNLNPMFKITSSYDFSEADKKKIAEAINISNVDPEKIKKGWEGRNLYISFAEELLPETLYTISMEEITDLETAVITPFEEFSFTTQSDVPVIPIEFYNIDYMLYGGVTESENPKTYSNASETFTLTNPTKPGYTFIGWTGSNGDTPQMTVIIEQGSTGDRNYTANYTLVAYSITYNLDGGINSPENPDGFNTASETFILHEPTKLGYEFIGWTGSNGNTPQMNVSVETGSTENRTYTANFRLINYSITYNNIDGCNFAEVNSENYDITSSTINISNPSKEGYDFIGWTGTGLDSASMTLSIPHGSTENRSYTANFTPTSYSIIYNNIENCTFATANPENYDITSTTITLNPPTRTGYNFLGWTSADIAVPQIDGVQITQGSTGDKTFTANWHLNLNLAITVDDDMLIDDVNNLYYTKSTFTITPTPPIGLALSDSEKSDIIGALRVKDSASNSVNIATASWNNEGKIALSFTSDLNASSTFSIALGDAEGMTLNCATYTFKTFYYKGRGINENRFQVENATQLDLVRNYLNKHFVQNADIDIATYTWVSIGYGNSFTGSYYGNGYAIKNLKLRNTDNPGSIGLFGYVEKDNSDANSGKIASVTIDGFSVRASDSAPDNPYSADAGIVACELGENCSIEYCKLIDSSNTGCLVKIGSSIKFGFITGSCYRNALINNCRLENITMNGNDVYDYCFLGGICSYNEEGTIDNCSVDNCNFTHWGGEIGGICCSNEHGSIKNCSLINSIINSKETAAGICTCAFSELSIENCIVDNSTIEGYMVGGISYEPGCKEITKCKVINGSYIKGKTTVGGIAGTSEGTPIDQCIISESTIEVTGGNNSSHIGGISGYGARVTSCYVLESTIKANVGVLCHIGGICGNNDSDILHCYVLNTRIQITNDDECNIGGICGTMLNSGINIKHVKSCYFYYDKDNQVPITTANINNNLGLLIGSVSDTTEISDCFTNKSGTLIGESTGTVTNCYDDIGSYEKFSIQTWSDGAWNAYKVGDDKPWPLDLINNPRQ